MLTYPKPSFLVRLDAEASVRQFHTQRGINNNILRPSEFLESLPSAALTCRRVTSLEMMLTYEGGSVNHEFWDDEDKESEDVERGEK